MHLRNVIVLAPFFGPLGPFFGPFLDPPLGPDPPPPPQWAFLALHL